MMPKVQGTERSTGSGFYSTYPPPKQDGTSKMDCCSSQQSCMGFHVSFRERRVYTFVPGGSRSKRNHGSMKALRFRANAPKPFFKARAGVIWLL